MIDSAKPQTEKFPKLLHEWVPDSNSLGLQILNNIVRFYFENDAFTALR